MTDTTSGTERSTLPRQAGRHAPEPTGWVGLIAFAGTMMMVVGLLHVFQCACWSHPR